MSLFWRLFRRLVYVPKFSSFNPRHKRLWLVILSFLSLTLAPSLRLSADVPPEGVPPSFQMVAENEGFQLYMDSSTLAFKLLDKRSNYLWHSGIDELLE